MSMSLVYNAFDLRSDDFTFGKILLRANYPESEVPG